MYKKKEIKRTFETKNVSYSEKNSKYFDYSTCLFRLIPRSSEKIRNRVTPPPPLVRKKIEIGKTT